MAATNSTKMAKLIKALVQQKPSEFNDTYSHVFKERIRDDTDKIKDDLKANMFKAGKHEVDFDKVTGRNQEVISDTNNDTQSDNPVDTESDIMKRYINGLDDVVKDVIAGDANRGLGS